jgi:biotin carboxylase
MTDWIIFLGASLDQVAGIRKCQELGFKVVAFDQNPDSPGFDAADVGLVISTHDVDGIKGWGDVDESLCPNKIAGVLTMGSDIPHIVAELAEHFGVPHVPMETARLCTDKYEMIRCLEDAKVPRPLYDLGDSAGFVKGWACGTTVVIKPVDRSGARGVYRLGPGDDHKKWFSRSMAWSDSGEVIVEEWVEGRQLSTETVMIDGRAVFTGISDRNYEHLERFAPLVIENGGWMPTALSPEEHAEVEAVIEQAANALGIKTGIAKGDLVYHPTRGPVVIEMACRLSGGDMSESLIPLSTGFDMLAAGVKLAVGRQDIHHGWPKYNNVICNRYFFPPTGRLVSVFGEERVRQQPWVHKLELWYQPGDTIPPITNHSSRAGVCVLEAPDRETMEDRIAWVYDTMLWEVEP